MTDKNTYYVMIVPTSKAKVKFNPCVLEYGLDYEKAKIVMRNFIMQHGLWFKVGGQKQPARVHIYRTSETLPENYFVAHSIWGVSA